MKTLAKIDSYVGGFLLCGAMVCFIALFFVLMGNLAVRLLELGNVMGWYTDLAEILFGWMVLFAAAVLAHHREHFRIDLLDMYFGKKRWFHALSVFTNIVALVFFLLLLYYSFLLFLGASQTMSVLQIERRWAYLCIPFNSLFLCIYALRDVALSWGKLAGPASS